MGQEQSKVPYASKITPISRSRESKNSNGSSARTKESVADSASNTTSNTSSSHEGNFKWMEGRQYHNVQGASYILPRDDVEVDRLHEQSFLIKEIFGGLFLPPAEELLGREEGVKVLDVACGPDQPRISTADFFNRTDRTTSYHFLKLSATWLLEMAMLYPNSEFTGVDISNVFPSEIKPSNLNFQIVNILNGLPFADNEFDFVQMRLLALALRVKEWPIVLKEIYRVTKPNGLIQLLEAVGGYVTTDPDALDFNQKVLYTLGARGQDPQSGERLHKHMAEAGFKVIQREKRSVPMGWGGGRIGDIMLEDAKQVALAAKPLLANVFGLENEEYNLYICDIFRKYQASKSYVNWIAVIGRKPIEI